MKKSKVTINATFETENPFNAIKEITGIIDKAKTGVNVSIEMDVKECKDDKFGFRQKAGVG